MARTVTLCSKRTVSGAAAPGPKTRSLFRKKALRVSERNSADPPWQRGSASRSEMFVSSSSPATYARAWQPLSCSTGSLHGLLRAAAVAAASERATPGHSVSRSPSSSCCQPCPSHNTAGVQTPKAADPTTIATCRTGSAVALLAPASPAIRLTAARIPTSASRACSARDLNSA